MVNKKSYSIISIIIVAIMIATLSSCTNVTMTESNKIKIVATIFPQYDFSKQIAGDNADVIILLAPGTESHTYEPTPLDMKKINDADIFIYTGEHMEPWAQSIVESIDNSELIVVDASNNIELCKTQDDDDSEKENEHELDPHIWLDPTLAMIMVDNIVIALSEIDQDNSELYKQNAKAYKQQLKKLDDDMLEVIDNAQRDTIVIGGRFAYAYLVNRYNINYVSAYDSCSKQDEPSVKSIIEVVEYIKQNAIQIIYHEELSDPKVAKSIAQQTGARLAVLHTLHNVSAQDMESEITYLDIMYKNLENLKKGLIP